MAFEKFPLMLTMEGQYIVKNVVLVSAGLVLLAALPTIAPHRHDAPSNDAATGDAESERGQRVTRRSTLGESARRQP